MKNEDVKNIILSFDTSMLLPGIENFLADIYGDTGIQIAAEKIYRALTWPWFMKFLPNLSQINDSDLAELQNTYIENGPSDEFYATLYKILRSYDSKYPAISDRRRVFSETLLAAQQAENNLADASQIELKEMELKFVLIPSETPKNLFLDIKKMGARISKLRNQ